MHGYPVLFVYRWELVERDVVCTYDNRAGLGKQLCPVSPQAGFVQHV
jgi:hypothetical protein